VDYIIFPNPRKTFFPKPANRDFRGKQTSKLA
jgi:hypothetical protein